MKSRKGFEASFGVIIGFVIAILIAVVILGIFITKAGTFNKGVEACEERGGVTRTGVSDCNEGESLLFKKDDKLCCYKIG